MKWKVRKVFFWERNDRIPSPNLQKYLGVQTQYTLHAHALTKRIAFSTHRGSLPNKQLQYNVQMFLSKRRGTSWREVSSCKTRRIYEKFEERAWGVQFVRMRRNDLTTCTIQPNHGRQGIQTSKSLIIKHYKNRYSTSYQH